MPITDLPVALIGFGNASQRLAELLIEFAGEMAREYRVKISCVAIATARHGCVVAREGLDLAEALALVKNNESLNQLAGAQTVEDAFAALAESGAKIMIETTTLNAKTGEPARAHVENALRRGMHVVTANKGPLAFAGPELLALGQSLDLCLRYESTVMDGAPIFNLAKCALPLVKIVGLRGIINSTVNFILTEMEQGNSFDAALAIAQARGIAEADASLDIDGWDAAVKLTVLANCLMGANLRPVDVERATVRKIDVDQLRRERARGNKIRLIASLSHSDGKIRARIAAETLSPEDLFYSIDAFSNALLLETDLMGKLAIIEQDPNITQTAYGLFSDLLSIISEKFFDK
jgi:homoserine dehydrogenase